MNDPSARTSPQLLARIAGVLYLIIIAIGAAVEMLVRDRLIVTGDATATAERIGAAEMLWRLSVAGNLFYLACAVVLALILYVLLRPAGRDLALLAVFFNLVSIAVEAVSKLRLLEALFPLAGTDYLSMLAPAELHALSYLSIRSHAYGFGVSLVFFGCFCIVLGYLIFRSGFLPRTIGALMQIAGLCYLTNSFALIIYPPLANQLFPTILLPALIGESSLCLWLLIRGVDVPRWRAQAHD